MKKLLIVMVAVLSLGFVTSQALACMWDGYWRGTTGTQMGGYGPGMNQGGAYQGFLNDTTKLRQELTAKQGEYSALMARTNPDPKRTKQLSQEIAGIHNQLQATAQAYGLAAQGSYGSAPMGGYGYNSGYGGWDCW